MDDLYTLKNMANGDILLEAVKPNSTDKQGAMSMSSVRRACSEAMNTFKSIDDANGKQATIAEVQYNKGSKTYYITVSFKLRDNQPSYILGNDEEKMCYRLIILNDSFEFISMHSGTINDYEESSCK